MLWFYKPRGKAVLHLSTHIKNAYTARTVTHVYFEAAFSMTRTNAPNELHALIAPFFKIDSFFCAAIVFSVFLADTHCVEQRSLNIG